MKKIFSIIFIIAMLASMISMIYTASADIQNNNVQIILRTKYLYFDKLNNGHRIQINITSNVQGNLTYLEEYYVTDQNGNPRLVNSGRYYDGPFTNNFISFEIVRPKKANDYSLIKGVVMINGQRLYDPWIGAGATYKYGIANNSGNSTVKIIKPTVQKRTAPFSTPTETDSGTVQKTADGKFSLITGIAIFIVYILANKNRKRN